MSWWVSHSIWLLKQYSEVVFDRQDVLYSGTFAPGKICTHTASASLSSSCLSLRVFFRSSQILCRYHETGRGHASGCYGGRKGNYMIRMIFCPFFQNIHYESKCYNFALFQNSKHFLFSNKGKINKIILLSQGSRMTDLTSGKAKCLLPVGGVPLVWLVGRVWPWLLLLWSLTNIGDEMILVMIMTTTQYYSVKMGSFSGSL